MTRHSFKSTDPNQSRIHKAPAPRHPKDVCVKDFSAKDSQRSWMQAQTEQFSRTKANLHNIKQVISM